MTEGDERRQPSIDDVGEPDGPRGQSRRGFLKSGALTAAAASLGLGRGLLAVPAEAHTGEGGGGPVARRGACGS